MRDSSDSLVWLKDIIQSIELIESYIADVSEKKFFSSQEKQDAIVRRLEIIGEAVRSLPADLKEQNPHIAWKEAAGMRNILVHEYFDVDATITWTALKNHLPEFKRQIKKLIDHLTKV